MLTCGPAAVPLHFVGHLPGDSDAAGKAVWPEMRETGTPHRAAQVGSR